MVLGGVGGRQASKTQLRKASGKWGSNDVLEAIESCLHTGMGGICMYYARVSCIAPDCRFDADSILIESNP